ncbi:MAG: hypothetical protein IPJ60_06255 [Sphingobacteriaceae bacterium]|nr:hypothetical protein [Sphingobacteriaceae bacterium]
MLAAKKIKLTPKITRHEKPLTIEDKAVAKKLDAIFAKNYSFKRGANGKGKLTISFGNDTELAHVLSYFGIE